MNSLLNEFSVDNSYMMLPSAYAALRSKIVQSLETGKDAEFEADKRLCSVAKFVSGQMNASSAKLTDFHAYNDDEDFDDLNVNAQSEVKYINIMNLTGMITRGDGYSYGSLVMRDYLMRAAGLLAELPVPCLTSQKPLNISVQEDKRCLCIATVWLQVSV